MKILIIGGAGFIGSHLCESYVNEHSFTSIDNYISGKKENHIAGVKYHDRDARDIFELDTEFDLIFHLGEYSRVEQSLNRIDFVLENNSVPILNILKFAKQSNAKLIKGVVCGYRIEEIDHEFEVYKRCRQMEKLIDELAKGRKMEKILRK